MANTYDLTCTIKKNGQPIPGFAPFVRRITCDEEQLFNYEKATGGGYVALPVTQLDEVQFLLVTSDKAITLRLDAQTDAGLVVNAGGVVLLLNVDIDAGASTNATVDNSSGETAALRGFASGT